MREIYLPFLGNCLLLSVVGTKRIQLKCIKVYSIYVDEQWTCFRSSFNYATVRAYVCSMILVYFVIVTNRVLFAVSFHRFRCHLLVLWLQIFSRRTEAKPHFAKHEQRTHKNDSLYIAQPW